MALGSHVHGEHTGEQIGVILPAARDVGAEGARGPGVEHVRVAGEPARRVALLGGVAGGNVGGRVDRQVGLVRDNRMVVIGFAVGVDRIPDGEGHTKEALPADQPVAVQPLDPVLVAVAHVGGVPGQLLAPSDEGRSEVAVAATVADVPLAAGDDLEGTLSALVELHGVLDRLRFAEQFARGGELLDHGALRLLHGEPGDC